MQKKKIILLCLQDYLSNDIIQDILKINTTNVYKKWFQIYNKKLYDLISGHNMYIELHKFHDLARDIHSISSYLTKRNNLLSQKMRKAAVFIHDKTIQYFGFVKISKYPYS